MLIKGTKLTSKQKQQVLSAYIYRRLDTTSKSDEEWLSKHAFYFIKDGSRLNARYKHCEPIFMADK